MNYATIKYYDIANGPGVRVSLFVSGCTHHCRGCFNMEAWDFDYGQAFTGEEAESIFDVCDNYYISGISILGGEPMEPKNQETLVYFLKEFKELFPSKTVWCYTGCKYEQLKGETRWHCAETDEMLTYIDVLVDGQFVEELKDISLKFRGSSNQRIIDMKATRNADKIVLWQSDVIEK